MEWSPHVYGAEINREIARYSEKRTTTITDNQYERACRVVNLESTDTFSITNQKKIDFVS